MLVLASASPRRRELIALLGVPFTVMPALYDEPPPPATPVSLPNLVTTLASAKALEVTGRLMDEAAVVIGADTLVTSSVSDVGIPSGKPRDPEDAVRMLRLLSGTTHSVHTGIAIARYVAGVATLAEARSVRTEVTFRELTREMVDDYVGTGEPMDKAGAYGAQGYAAPFIESFQGDFYNVVGLPLCELGKLLESCGVEWWRQRMTMPPVIG